MTSSLLNEAGFRHAFFTTRGGVSRGAYASLNFSYSVGDEPEAVTQNIESAATWLGIQPAQLYFAQQVHGTHSIILDNQPSEEVRSMQADAVIASNPAQACCVRTADCVPILVADRQSGRVAAIHAGWRGVAAGIVSKTLTCMLELGSHPSQLIAAIGPHIRASVFEVSNEVAELIGRATPGVDTVRRSGAQRPHVALVESLFEQLRAFGVSRDRIQDVGGCTASEPERFFSYRRSGPQSGRHLHAILPRKPLQI